MFWRTILFLFLSISLWAAPTATHPLLLTHQQAADKFASNNKALEAIIESQTATLNAQAVKLSTLEKDRVAAQTVADTLKASDDRHVTQANKANAKVFELETFKQKMDKYWGFGAVGYGLKEAFWHIVWIVTGFSALIFGLSFFIPGLKNIVGLGIAWIVRIFSPKPRT